MIIDQNPQGSEGWLRARAAIPTASDLDQLIAWSRKDGVFVRRGWDTEMPNTYLARKLAEKWLGSPLQTFSGGPMEQGKILEEEAIPWLALHTGSDLKRVGLVLRDDRNFGASPDAMLGDDGYEIKCPEPKAHFKWLLHGECPGEHLLQCHGGMYVTGAKRWTFVSYCRNCPPLVAEVEHDDVTEAVIADAVSGFNARMALEWDSLVKRYGSPPERVSSSARDIGEIDDDPFCTRETP